MGVNLNREQHERMYAQSLILGLTCGPYSLASDVRSIPVQKVRITDSMTMSSAFRKLPQGRTFLGHGTYDPREMLLPAYTGDIVD